MTEEQLELKPALYEILETLMILCDQAEEGKYQLSIPERALFRGHTELIENRLRELTAHIAIN